MAMVILLLSLVSSSFALNPNCALEFGQIYQSQTNPLIPKVYSMMYSYSGATLNDLGEFDSCNEISIARYAVAVFSELPLFVKTFCGPKSCSEQDYFELLSQSSNGASFEIIFPKSYQEDHYDSYDPRATALIVIMVLFAFVALSSGILDYILKEDQKDSSWIKYLLCFSLIRNGKTLLVSRAVEKLGKRDTFELLDALRVMSLAWVILGHVNITSLYWSALGNSDYIYEQYKDVFYMLNYGFYYAVDCFFWIAAFLMAYFFIETLESENSSSFSKILKLYAHRYLRITPVYMFVIFFFTCIQEYLGSGPLYFKIDRLNKDCEDYWYTNLFYLNNFIPDYKGNFCLVVSWYLANDMQFFLFGSLTVFLYVKVNKIFGWVLIFLYILLNCLSGGFLADHYDVNAATQFMPLENYVDYQYYLYTKPYARVAPYALGLGSAFIVYSYRNTLEKKGDYDRFASFLGKIQENLIVRIITFGFGLALINIILFCLYDTYRHPGDNFDYSHWSRTKNTMFFTFDRVTYGFGLTFIFLPLLLGHFHWLTRVLSGSIWSFVSRLTFTMYLIHINIMQTSMLSLKSAYTMSVYTQIIYAVFFFAFALVCSIPFVLLIEMPFINIEKQLLGPKIVKVNVETEEKQLYSQQ